MKTGQGLFLQEQQEEGTNAEVLRHIESYYINFSKELTAKEIT